ncbi:MAG: FHA domain-containing protein [Cytophagales bacterium]|nr:FHA domain-containing protein [Cytophagales bacterium]
MGYYCMLCDTYYEIPTSDFICQAPDCPGGGITGLLIDEKTYLTSGNDHENRLQNLNSDLSFYSGGSTIGFYLKEVKIGRSPQNDIVLNHSSISNEHAVITMDRSNKIRIVDLNSTNGTYVNGQKIDEASLRKSDRVSVGRYPVEWTPHFQSFPSKGTVTKRTIGRGSKCDIVIGGNDVSRLHATLWYSENGDIQIQDENSSNGVYINGQKIVGIRQIKPTDEILIAKRYELQWSDIKQGIN